MKLARLKVITASVIVLLGSHSGNVLAYNGAASQRPDAAAQQSQDRASGTAQAPAARAPQPYRGYPPRRYYRGYDRDWVRPFGSRGPDFRGPWKRGSGTGFSTGGPSFGSGGPSFGSSRGPRYGSWDDWGPGPYVDEPYFDEPYYGRGPRFYDSGPGDWDWGGSGMGFGW